jgi:hypothetical protein
MFRGEPRVLNHISADGSTRGRAARRCAPRPNNTASSAWIVACQGSAGRAANQTETTFPRQRIHATAIQARCLNHNVCLLAFASYLTIRMSRAPRRHDRTDREKRRLRFNGRPRCGWTDLLAPEGRWLMLFVRLRRCSPLEAQFVPVRIGGVQLFHPVRCNRRRVYLHALSR